MTKAGHIVVITGLSEDVIRCGHTKVPAGQSEDLTIAKVPARQNENSAIVGQDDHWIIAEVSTGQTED